MTATDWTTERRAEVLRTAIRSAGGPNGAATAAIKRHVDAAHADYPWQTPWHAEIRGAVLGDRIRHGEVSFEHASTRPAPTVHDEAATAPTPIANQGFDPQEIERARVFIATLGNGSVDDSRDVLEFLLEFGDLTNLGDAIETWGDLLEAVRGDDDAARRVLSLVADRLGTPGFPRLATDTTARRAA